VKLCEWCFINQAESFADVGGGRLHVCGVCERRVVGYRLTSRAVAGAREGARQREIELRLVGLRLA
jgi:hypothetical protein